MLSISDGRRFFRLCAVTLDRYYSVDSGLIELGA
jgi:hypothetical protein